MEGHNIVIIGGGAGGLELAVGLAKKYRKNSHQVVLVDKEKVHLWKPHLHEIASGTLDSHYEQVDYLSLANKYNFRFVWGELGSVNRHDKKIILKEKHNKKGELIIPEREITYDKLVIGIGSTSNDFGTPGVREFAFSLDNLCSANTFQKTLLEKIIQKEHCHGDENFVITIVGGGATGVELAAELNETTRKLSAFGLDKLKNRPLKLNVVNAAAQLLPGLSQKISDGAKDILESFSVNILNNSKVVAIKQGEVVIEKEGHTESLMSDMIVWAAGVKSDNLLAGLDGLEVTRSNQLVVNDLLQTTLDEHVFAIGDCCAVKWVKAPKDGMLVPPRAQAAHQMSEYLIANFDAIIAGKIKADSGKGFVYRDLGSLVSLGENDTVGTLMGFLQGKSLFVEGKIAKFMYLWLYHSHQIKINGWIAAMGLLMGKHIQKRFRPKVKLH